MPSQIEYLRSQIEEVERNLRILEERKDQYVDKTTIPVDLIKNEQLQQERLRDLRQRLEILTNPTPLSQGAATAPVRLEIDKIYVDRDEERRQFRNMISGDTPIHILLIRADSGMGKTVLLEQFWEMSEGYQRASIDFKHSSYSMGEILREMSDQFGPQFFSMFQEVCCEALSELGQDVKHPALMWTAIDLRLAKLLIEDRKKYQQLITQAFLANLETIRERDQPIVVFFDTFEKGSELTKEWITEFLLGEIRRYPRLVCVISGQVVPRVPTQDVNWCLQQTLQPLSVEHRIEYIQKVKITQNEDLVTFIVKHSKGNPHELQQLVLTLLEE